MTPKFRILPFVVVSLVVMIGLRGIQIWTGFSAISAAHAVDAKSEKEKPESLASAPAHAADSTGADAAPEGPATTAANTDAEAHGGATSDMAAGTADTHPSVPHSSAEDGQAPSGVTGAIPPASADAKDPNIPALGEPDAPAPAIAEASPDSQHSQAAPAAKRPKIPGEEDFMSASEIEVLTSLTKRREELDKRSAELDMRDKLLQATEQRLNQKLAEIKALESKIQGAVHTLDDKQEKQIASLVKVYQNMKPKDAASIMQGLDRNILLEVASRIKEQKMAPILAAMDPAKARELTVLLAKHNEVPGESS